MISSFSPFISYIWAVERYRDGWQAQRVSKPPSTYLPTQIYFINSTTFGLYRDGTELRGVYYSNPRAARAACLSMGDKCDYPILMGMFRNIRARYLY